MSYNVGNGGNTLEESEVLEPVHSCLRELLERERQGKAWNQKFTDHDVIAITLLYSMIMGNRLYHYLSEEKASITIAASLSQHYTAAIQETTFSMSRVNVAEYYKERDSKQNGAN